MNKKIISVVLIMILLLLSLSSVCHASASAKSFSSSKSNYYENCGAYAAEGFGRLGYSPSSSSFGGITRDSMLDWIRNSGNGYAMYVHTFGGSGYFNDYYGYSIDASMISGNWDFVYIDSSYSAATNELANAFHTIGYSKRCFLGWSGAITTTDSECFNGYFWLNYAGRGGSIRSCALNAAACVPGSGTTPTRFYGDSTYTGIAR